MIDHMLIGDERVTGDGPSVAIHSPHTGDTIYTIAEASEDQIETAIYAANAAFESWSRTTPQERSYRLLAVADAIEAESEIFAALEAENCGKPRDLVLRDELPAIVDCWRYFAGAIRCQQAAIAGEYLKGFTSMIRRDAVGVVVAIAPWNYPLLMMAWKLAPAIAAGNCVVFKPSELTPLTALKMGSILADLLPKGVVNIVLGRGETVGQNLISHTNVDMISVTGEISTGEKMLKASASGIKRTHLELGGNAPVIVLDDADIENVVRGVREFGYYNAGQDCASACRVYAQDRVYEKLVSELADAVSSIQFANADDSQNEIGPLISKNQLDRVSNFIDHAVNQQHIETIVGGGISRQSGYYYRPTLLAGTRQGDDIVKKEVFGPVVTITRFHGIEEAIALANDSIYGLASSVWTQNITKAIEISSQLRYGCTWINTHLMQVNEMPHTGMKQSGYGSSMSMHSLEEYSTVRHIMISQ